MAFKLSFPFSCIFFLSCSLLPLFSLSHYPHLQQNELIDNNIYLSPSPFGFLKNIQGCRRGDNVKGIARVKLYLSHFGYLKHQTNLNVTNPEEDYFNAELEAAIKSYQVYYNLNTTGTLDAQTVHMMITPRCGFPDKETHKSLRIVSHYQLFPSSPRWPEGKRHLTYGFGSRFPTAFMPAVARAFSRWANASGYFTFSRARTRQSADLKTSFARGSHGDGAPFDGPGGVLAHAFGPTDGRLHFDVDDQWTVGSNPNAFDIETLALHEIGHLLGLGHSQYPNAIMWAAIGSGQTKGLTLDDVRGLRALYGVNM